MNTKMKKLLTGVASLLLVVALIVVAPISRIVYGIYDANRTNEILAQLEAEEKGDGEVAVNDFHKQAYFSTAQETDGDKTVEKIDLLVLTSDSGYELTYYERTVAGGSSYTSEYFRMTGAYTRAGNMLILGYGNGAFGPDDPITREQMAVIFYRYSKLCGYSLTEGSYEHFEDHADISNYAQQAMRWAVGNSLMIGGTDNCLYPRAYSEKCTNTCR